MPLPELDRPDVVAEVTAAFHRYEKALNENDLAVLGELFWNSPATIRYGIAEQLYGYEAIQGFRSNRPAIDLRRKLTRVAIHAYGADFATASCEYERLETGRKGRQMQTWMRTPEGWRVIAAHVSMLPG